MEKSIHLTTRQTQVLDELMSGNRRQDVADHLGISLDTVRAHQVNIFTKIENFTGSRPRSRMEAIRQLDDSSPPCLDEFSLSPRRKEVVLGVLYGLSNKEIATRMDITLDTVKETFARACKEMGVKGGRRGLLALFSSK